MVALGVPTPNIADVFSVDLSVGQNQTIFNGLDYQANDLLIWSKQTVSTTAHYLIDTVRGNTKRISSNLSDAESATLDIINSFNVDGFNTGSNVLGDYAHWSFKKSPKFLDIIRYSGNGAVGRVLLHDLGVPAGQVIVKRLNAVASWGVQHIATGGTKHLLLDSTSAAATSAVLWNDTAMDDVGVTVGNNSVVNASGGEYIMYVFAHDDSAGSIIRCGEFNAAGGDVFINLGWDAQYVEIKPYDSTGDWEVYDTTRGTTKEINPNLSAAESTTARITLGSGGFTFNPSEAKNYIYKAIRAE